MNKKNLLATGSGFIRLEGGRKHIKQDVRQLAIGAKEQQSEEPRKS